MYNNLLSNQYNGATNQLNQIQQQQQQQYLLQEFLKTERGQKAHDSFVKEQTEWWNEVNGIAPKKAEENKISELEEKLDKMTSLVSNMAEQLGVKND